MMSMRPFIPSVYDVSKKSLFLVFFIVRVISFRSLSNSNHGFALYKRFSESSIMRNRFELHESDKQGIIYYNGDESYDDLEESINFKTASNIKEQIYTINNNPNDKANATATLLSLVAFGDKYFRKDQGSNTQSFNNARNDYVDDTSSNDRAMPAFLSASASSNGGDYKSSSSDRLSTISSRRSEWTKVVGCIADVRIQLTLSFNPTNNYSSSSSSSAAAAMIAELPVTINNSNSISDNNSIIETSSNIVHITGIADSKIAQGMLALICKNLSGLTAAEILSLSVATLTHEWGLSALGLPIGRMNGFANMMMTVQNLIKQLQYHSIIISQEKGQGREGEEGEEDIHQQQQQQQQQQVQQSQQSDRNAKIIHEMYHNNPSISTPSSPSTIISSTTTFTTTSPPIPPSIYHPDEVAVLLSGGVDSSVALKLLLIQGYKVRAFYLKIWLEDELAHLNECPWEEDLEYATSVCEQLGVPLETLSLQKEYWTEVVQYTLAEAKLGRTPNPDIMCNSRIKFGMFYKYIGQYYYKVATGHYAQVRKKSSSSSSSSSVYNNNIATVDDVSPAVAAVAKDSNHILMAANTSKNINNNNNNTDDDDNDEYDDDDDDEYELFCSQDPLKDQTYFLCNLRQDQLAKALFPIGHLKKPQVRELAELYQLPTRLRKDSQGICFLGKLKFEDFIEHYLGKQPGEIRDYVTGSVVGTHHGLWFHTVGQRKGLGPYMNKGTLHLGPWFVADKDADTNTLFVTNDLQTIDKPRTEFRVHHINWISGQPPPELLTPPHYSMKLTLKLRHGPTFSQGTVTLLDSRPVADVTTTTTTASGVVTGAVSSDEDDDDDDDAPIIHSDIITTHTITKSSSSVQQQQSQLWSSPNALLSVKLHEKDKGIAPGQFAAFYHNDVCLGAGVIADTARDRRDSVSSS